MTNNSCKIHSEISHEKSINPNDHLMIPVLPISIWWFFTRNKSHRNKVYCNKVYRNKVYPGPTEKKAP